MKIKTLLLSCVLTVISSAAFAGASSVAPVVIELEEMLVYGDMKSSRFSENKNEFLGCGTRTSSFPGGDEVYEWGFCQAGVSEDTGTKAFCMTRDPALLNEIRSLSAFSFIVFRWNAEGDCDYIGTSSQSVYIPNKKDLQKK